MTDLYGPIGCGAWIGRTPTRCGDGGFCMRCWDFKVLRVRLRGQR